MFLFLYRSFDVKRNRFFKNFLSFYNGRQYGTMGWHIVAYGYTA